ncbi:DUF982 domain-containing protein [Mesorhizobium sp. M6A.T.Ce.TU.002.03.1.1]|nr:DUF982 domain-containing protein [Mesorhizobium sp. M6A.T.Ce.TU.002.03.1.1]RWO94054.1 MAG: DUF982 domain-containing protein [Mesorhizobium sp.]
MNCDRDGSRHSSSERITPLRRCCLRSQGVPVMRDEQFDIPVTIESERIGRPLSVTRTVQAASLLVDKWPDERRGPKYRAALKALMDAMEQRRAVGSARRAFTAAAKEAHLFVREGRH